MSTTFATSRVIAAIAGIFAVAAISAGPVAAKANAESKSDNGNRPPGNNGTIKIDEFPVDGDTGNDPHVGCQFAVKFFGYDAGSQTGRLVFEGQAPTGGGLLQDSTTGWTTGDRTGGNQLDTSYGPVNLTDALTKAGVTPSQQGFHVKLTVHVTGSQGSDAKHKVFWIEPCSSAASPPAAATLPQRLAPATAPAAPTASGPVVAPTAAPAAPAAVMGETLEAASLNGPSAEHPVQVMGEEISNEEEGRNGTLPFTGVNVALLLMAAGGLLGAGIVAVRTAKARA